MGAFLFVLAVLITPAQAETAGINTPWNGPRQEFSLTGEAGQPVFRLDLAAANNTRSFDLGKDVVAGNSRWTLLAQDGEASPAIPDGLGNDPAKPPLERPAYMRPKASFGQFCLDLLVTSVGTVAWKRALNVTAARRILVGTYDNYGTHLTTTPPINDANNWTTNWIGHPLLGAFFYEYFRSRAHSRMASALGAILTSSVHEYLIEASFEPASGIDLIQTPALGIPIGILADEVSVRWIRSDSTTKRFFGYFMNPFIAMPWSAWRRDVQFDPKTDRFTVEFSWDY